jgi:hypothetical protein
VATDIRQVRGVTGVTVHTVLPGDDDSIRVPFVYTSEPDGDERAGGVS